MINRKRRLIFFFAINIFLVFAALFLVLFAKFVSGTPLAKITDCPSHIFFGVYCPFCGGTRAMSALMRFDVVASLIYNPAIIPSMIAFGVYDILALRAILKNEQTVLHVHKWVWISLTAILLLNWIIRNMLLLIWNIDYIAMVF